MNLLKDLPWLLVVIITALLVLGGIGYLSILQSIDGHPRPNNWVPGRWFILGLVGLALVALAALFMVSLLNF